MHAAPNQMGTLAGTSRYTTSESRTTLSPWDHMHLMMIDPARYVTFDGLSEAQLYQAVGNSYHDSPTAFVILGFLMLAGLKPCEHKKFSDILSSLHAGSASV